MWASPIFKHRQHNIIKLDLNNLPKKGERIFQSAGRTLEANFYLQRKKIAKKLNNPRMLKISLHTLKTPYSRTATMNFM